MLSLSQHLAAPVSCRLRLRGGDCTFLYASSHLTALISLDRAGRSGDCFVEFSLLPPTQKVRPRRRSHSTEKEFLRLPPEARHTKKYLRMPATVQHARVHSPTFVGHVAPSDSHKPTLPTVSVLRMFFLTRLWRTSPSRQLRAQAQSFLQQYLQ